MLMFSYNISTEQLTKREAEQKQNRFFNKKIVGHRNMYTGNYLQPAGLNIVQRDESFYVCYFLCDTGVTEACDLHAILPINPWPGLLHTSTIP